MGLITRIKQSFLYIVGIEANLKPPVVVSDTEEDLEIRRICDEEEMQQPAPATITAVKIFQEHQYDDNPALFSSTIPEGLEEPDEEFDEVSTTTDTQPTGTEQLTEQPEPETVGAVLTEEPKDYKLSGMADARRIRIKGEEPIRKTKRQAAVLDDIQKKTILELSAARTPAVRTAAYFGVSRTVIGNCHKGVCWKNAANYINEQRLAKTGAKQLQDEYNYALEIPKAEFNRRLCAAIRILNRNKLLDIDKFCAVFNTSRTKVLAVLRQQE